MKLAASQNARVALERRKLEERAAIVRGRLEAVREAGLMPLMNAIDNRISLLQFSRASDLLDDADRRLEEYMEMVRRTANANDDRAQDEMLKARGVQTDRAADGSGARDGFLWIYRKGRISRDRFDAGQRWGADYSLLRTDGIRSCLNDNVRGGQVNEPGEQRVFASQRLSAAKAHIRAATGDARIADLLDAVCGRGETLLDLAGKAEGRERRAIMLEADLLTGLDMAGVSYGILSVAA